MDFSLCIPKPEIIVTELASFVDKIQGQLGYIFIAVI